MKTQLISIFLLTSILALLMIPGCKGAGSGGDVVTEKKDVSNFNALDIGSAFEVDIRQSDTYSLTLHADESYIDYIEVTQTGNLLKIYLSPRHIFTDFTLGDRELRAEITLPDISQLVVSGATKGTVTGFSSHSSLGVVVSGASTLKMDSIAAGITDIEVSGASTLTGNLTASTVNFIISGASSLELSGTADIAGMEVSGASHAQLEKFKTQAVTANVNGASSATINVEQTLNVEVSGASSLYFIGNPTLGTTTISGASTIKHKD
jgi:hypothetical protein